MKGLTPLEHAALSRLLLPVSSRPFMGCGSGLDLASHDLVEQGRATYTAHAVPPPNAYGGVTRGRFDLTPAGREALRLYPLMLAVQEAA